MISASLLFPVIAVTLMPADTTPKALEGRWVFQTSTCDGSVMTVGPDVPFSPHALEIRGDRLAIRLPGGNSLNLKLTVDESVTPKRIDATGPNGEALRGIFAVDGDLLMICVRLEENGKRPTTFATLTNDKTYLYLLSRQR